MRKKTEEVIHECKGILTSFDGDTVMVEIIKKDDVLEDVVSINSFIKDLEAFFEANEGNDVLIKLSAKAVS